MVRDQFDLRGGPYKYQPDELVIALEHLGLVAAELDRLRVPHTGPVRSPLLGLAKVTLTKPECAARRVTAEAHRSKADRNRPQSTSGLALDRILWGLRAIFADRYAGWSPTVGKNRFVGSVLGAGEVSHGGVGAPMPGGEVSHGQISTGGVGAPMPSGEVSHGSVGVPTWVEGWAQPAPRPSGPGRGVRVGVLDTGLFRHPWLAGGWAARFSDIIPDGAVVPEADGHATFITGLVLSRAPGALVEVRQILRPDGTADSWSVAEGIVRFGHHGLDVLNLSFVCYTEDGEPPLVLATAMDRLDPDVVVVAAAGNHGEIGGQGVKPAWPAALDDVIAVGVAENAGRRAEFSPNAPWVDLHTEGVDLRSTFLMRARPTAGDPPTNFQGWAIWSGTSFAAALVSGAIAAGVDPGLVSGREAARDILDSLDQNALTPLGDTQAKFLSLRSW